MGQRVDSHFVTKLNHKKYVSSIRALDKQATTWRDINARQEGLMYLNGNLRANRHFVIWIPSLEFLSVSPEGASSLRTSSVTISPHAWRTLAASCSILPESGRPSIARRRSPTFSVPQRWATLPRFILEITKPSPLLLPVTRIQSQNTVRITDKVM